MDISQITHQLITKINEHVAEIECIGKRLKSNKQTGKPKGNIEQDHLSIIKVLRQLEECKALVIERYPRYERIFNELLPLLEASYSQISEVAVEEESHE